MLKKRYIVSLIVAALFVVAVVLYCFFMQFQDFNVEEILHSETAGKTNYERAFGGLMMYNPDGVILMDESGNTKWNVSFEMQDPRVVKNEAYAIVYDRQGSSLEILNATGEISRINTSFPITSACLSKKGEVSVIMQIQDTSYITTYASEGSIIAQGEIHAQEGGYPMAISLSDNGETLALSVLHLSGGTIETNIVFYDFSGEKNIKEKKESKSYTIDNEVVPVIDYISGGNLLAIGTNSIYMFTSGPDAEMSRDIVLENEIKSSVHNEEYFGIISESENESGEIINVLDFYSVNGVKRFSKEIDVSYNKCELMDNNEVFMSDGKTASIYTTLGVRKFYHEFESDVSDIIPTDNLWNYYLLQAGELSRIKIK